MNTSFTCPPRFELARPQARARGPLAQRMTLSSRTALVPARRFEACSLSRAASPPPPPAALSRRSQPLVLFRFSRPLLYRLLVGLLSRRRLQRPAPPARAQAHATTRGEAKPSRKTTATCPCIPHSTWRVHTNRHTHTHTYTLPPQPGQVAKMPAGSTASVQ